MCNQKKQASLVAENVFAMRTRALPPPLPLYTTTRTSLKKVETSR